MSGIKKTETLQFIRDVIKKHNISQASIAKELGITPQVLSRQLNGRDPLSLKRADEIINCIHISQHELVEYKALLVDDQQAKGEGKNVNEMFGKMWFIEKLGPNFKEDYILAALIELWPETLEDKIQLLNLAIKIDSKNRKAFEDDNYNPDEIARFNKEHPRLLQKWIKEVNVENDDYEK